MEFLLVFVVDSLNSLLVMQASHSYRRQPLCHFRFDFEHSWLFSLHVVPLTWLRSKMLLCFELAHDCDKCNVMY